MECEYCNVKLVKVDRRNEMAELDDDATDGQMADFFAAELSGDNGAWNIGIVEYICPKCKRNYQVMSDHLQNYNGLIINWHRKASEGDYFSRYVFEYLAFIAHLKNNLYWKESNDRMAIQRLKQSECKKVSYLALVENNQPLQALWMAVVHELSQHPLHNTSRDLDYPELDDWWNNSDDRRHKNDKSRKGIVESPYDWENMVEFWYAVRNNLFHGGKDPNLERDQFLVEHSYKTMEVFMECEIRILNS